MPLFRSCCAEHGAVPPSPVRSSLFGKRGEWSDWSSHPVLDEYDPIEECGRGGFSKVYKATRKKDGAVVALKVLFKKMPEITTEDLALLRGEVDVLQDIGGHPEIVELLGTSEDESQLVLVLELLDGGEMLDHIQQLEKYSEKIAAHLFKQQLSAVAMLHKRGYIHRDLKPENILFTSVKVLGDFRAGHGEDPSMLQVKMVDFGMAVKFDSRMEQRSTLGTVGFMAPEICLDEPNTPAMDMWSLGMILFAMLCGGMPYTSKQIADLNYAAIPFKKAAGFRHKNFKSLSKAAQDLITRLLQHDPKRRLSAKDALMHPWLSEGSSPAQVLSKSAIDALNKFARDRKAKGLYMPCHIAEIADGLQLEGRCRRFSTHAGEQTIGGSYTRLHDIWPAHLRSYRPDGLLAGLIGVRQTGGQLKPGAILESSGLSQFSNVPEFRLPPLNTCDEVANQSAPSLASPALASPSQISQKFSMDQDIKQLLEDQRQLMSRLGGPRTTAQF